MFANGHNLTADEPESYGGTNKGPSPPYDYLQASLGACTAMTVQMYARRKKWPLDEAVVRMRYEKSMLKIVPIAKIQNRKLIISNASLNSLGGI